VPLSEKRGDFYSVSPRRPTSEVCLRFSFPTIGEVIGRISLSRCRRASAFSFRPRTHAGSPRVGHPVREGGVFSFSSREEHSIFFFFFEGAARVPVCSTWPLLLFSFSPAGRPPGFFFPESTNTKSVVYLGPSRLKRGFSNQGR